MSDFEETPALVDTTGITVSLVDTSITNGKRLRRERSHAGRAHNGNASRKDKKTKKKADSISYPQNNGISIFVQKTFSMIDTCDSNLAEWTSNGEMFVVKDPTRFASDVIPKYFDHEKFASFTRQLNFYGFQKVQVKPLMKSDIDESTMNHVTFRNENFKRDNPELLVNIQRSTNKPDAPTVQELQRQIDSLNAEIVSYKGEVQQLNDSVELFERRCSYLETRLNQGRPNTPVIASSAAIDVEERSSYSKKPLNLERPDALEEIGRMLSTASIDSFTYLETHLNQGRPNAPVIASSAAIDVEERSSYSKKPLSLERPDALEEIGRMFSISSIDSFRLSLASMPFMTFNEQPSNSDRFLKLAPATLARHRSM